VTHSLNGGTPKELMARINYNVQPGPDGKPWCNMTIVTPMTSASILVNQDTVEQWAAEMPKTLRDLVALMKQAASGLVIANSEDLKRIKRLDDGNQ
jgi:hypothetical protein